MSKTTADVHKPTIPSYIRCNSPRARFRRIVNEENKRDGEAPGRRRKTIPTGARLFPASLGLNYGRAHRDVPA